MFLQNHYQTKQFLYSKVTRWPFLMDIFLYVREACARVSEEFNCQDCFLFHFNILKKYRSSSLHNNIFINVRYYVRHKRV